MAQTNQKIVITTEMRDNLSNAANKVANNLNKVGKESKEAERSMFGFHMEQLGVMFAGMALNRAMSNLSSTARDWVGMNELMSIAMGQLMLPTTLDLLNDAVIPLFNALTELPEPAQKAIGNTALALEGVGAVMMTGGQFALGINSGMQMLEKLSGSLYGTQEFSDKLKTSLGKIVKYGGATILFGLALKDGAEGELQAAIGDAMMGVGLLKGGKAGLWLGVIGFGLKLTGDTEFLASVVSIFVKVVDLALLAGEEIGNAIFAAIMPGKEYEMSEEFKKSIGEAVVSGVEQADVKSSILKKAFNIDQGFSGYGAPVFKGSELGSSAQTVTFNNNFNITGVSSPKDVQNMIDKSQNSLVSKLRSLIKV